VLREELEILVAEYLHASEQHDAVGCAMLFTDDAYLFSPYGSEAQGCER